MTAEVILSELGDISRFRNAKAVCTYARLIPLVRQSGGRKSKDLKITKEGSGLLRWALVEAVWRLVAKSPKWAALFARLMHRSGKKRAIVAVARKLLCVLYAMLRTSTPYKIVTTPTDDFAPHPTFVGVRRRCRAPSWVQHSPPGRRQYATRCYVFGFSAEVWRAWFSAQLNQ